MNVRRRDQRGRFLPILEEIENGFNFVLIIFRAIPYLIIVFILYKYFDVTVFISKLMLEYSCGKHCSCKCPKENNGFSD